MLAAIQRTTAREPAALRHVRAAHPQGPGDEPRLQGKRGSSRDDRRGGDEPRLQGKRGSSRDDRRGGDEPRLQGRRGSPRDDRDEQGSGSPKAKRTPSMEDRSHAPESKQAPCLKPARKGVPPPSTGSLRKVGRSFGGSINRRLLCRIESKPRFPTPNEHAQRLTRTPNPAQPRTKTHENQGVGGPECGRTRTLGPL